MKIFQEKLPYKNINSLVLSEIDIDCSKDLDHFINVLKYIIMGKVIFLELMNADTFFCPDHLLEFYQDYLPKLIQQNGKYIVTHKKNDSRFQSIANIEINNKTLLFIEHIWRYYLGVLFFVPGSAFSLEEFQFKKENFKPDIYGMGYIKNNITDMTFTKGHDGDNLIITFNSNIYDTEEILHRICKIVELEPPY